VDELSVLLDQAQAGDETAKGKLFSIAYEELRMRARNQLNKGGRNTLLDTTALVHESFMRFVNAGQLKGRDRDHFFAYAARVMRSVIVDFARRRLTERRGGDVPHVSWNTQLAENHAVGDEQVVRINDAMEALEAEEPRLVRVVEMRYFVGMEVNEIAAALGVTDRTVRRDWEKARLLLAAMLQ
jgi:RNA polymerase sigma factor (TIGR02999 family)